MVYQVHRSTKSGPQEGMDHHEKWQGELYIKIQSKEKLAKDEDMVLVSYRYPFCILESMIEIHRVPSIEEVEHVRKWEDISREEQAFADTYKHASLVEDLSITKENIIRYIMDSVRMYTK